MARDIALVGRARSGKDTAASRLIQHHSYFRVAFADQLKKMALNINPLIGDSAVDAGWRLRTLVHRVGWERAKDEFPEVRRFLQEFGHRVREQDPEFWLRIAERKIDGAKRWGGPVVVTDCRYPNELEYLRARGFLIVEILRSGVYPSAGEHASETALDGHEVDATVFNTEGVEYLHEQIERIALTK